MYHLASYLQNGGGGTQKPWKKNIFSPSYWFKKSFLKKFCKILKKKKCEKSVFFVESGKLTDSLFRGGKVEIFIKTKNYFLLPFLP